MSLCRLGLSEAELVKIIPDYSALVVRSETKVTAPSWKPGKRLRVVGRAGVGVDNVDVETATRRGVIVMNAPGGNTVSTAEHAFSLVALCRAQNSRRPTRWCAAENGAGKNFQGVELYNKIVRHYRHGPNRQRTQPARDRFRHARPRLRSLSLRESRARACRSSWWTNWTICWPRPISSRCTRRSRLKRIILLDATA